MLFANNSNYCKIPLPEILSKQEATVRGNRKALRIDATYYGGPGFLFRLANDILKLSLNLFIAPHK
jgi:hypothetical protein